MKFSSTKYFILGGIFILAFLIRFLPVYLTYDPERPILNTPDAFYHIRRVIVAINNFPNLPFFDYYISYPTGGYCIWPPLFDFLAATLSYTLFLGKPSATQIEWVCAIYPILFALAVMVLLYFITKKILNNELAAFFSLFLFAILPASFLWTKLGYFDHHIAETFGLLLIFYTLILTKYDEKITYWFLLGICFGVALLLWQGSILFIGAAFFILLFQRRFKAFISFMVSILVILPFSINTHYPDSPFSYRGLSLLHISLLLIGAMILLIPLIYQKSKLISVIPSGLLAILLFFLFRIPSYIKGIFFIFKKDPWLDTIIEFQPLVIQKGYLSTLPVKQLFGLAYFLFPLILFIMIIEYRKDKELIFPFTIFTLLTGCLSFITARFSVWFIPFYVILFAFFIKKVMELFGNKIGLIISVVIMIINFSAFKKETYKTDPNFPNKDELKACRWLSDSTPETRGFLNPTEKPEYGIMCFWGCGHFILYLAKRPVAASNFGNDVPNFDIVNRFFVAQSEEEAKSIMDTLNCRYVFIADDMFFVYLASKYLKIDSKQFFDFYYVKPGSYDIFTVMNPNEKGVRTTVFRLAHNLGLGFSYEQKFIPPFRHFRLRFISGNIRIFEYVKGAIIKGKLDSDEEIKISGDISLGELKLKYFDIVSTDAQGNFELVVPYPQMDTGYELITRKKKFLIKVSDEDIFYGNTIILKHKD